MKFQFIVDNLNGQAPERRITSECHSAQWQIYSGPRESADLTLEESLSTSVSMGDIESFGALEHETQSFGCLRKALGSLKCSNSEQNVSSAKISQEKQRKGLPSLSPFTPHKEASCKDGRDHSAPKVRLATSKKLPLTLFSFTFPILSSLCLLSSFHLPECYFLQLHPLSSSPNPPSNMAPGLISYAPFWTQAGTHLLAECLTEVDWVLVLHGWYDPRWAGRWRISIGVGGSDRTARFLSLRRLPLGFIKNPYVVITTIMNSVNTVGTIFKFLQTEQKVMMSLRKLGKHFKMLMTVSQVWIVEP